MSAQPSLLDRAIDRAGSVADLAAVPVVLSLLAIDKVTTALGAGGAGITFPMPPAIGTLWTFVSLPGGGGFVTPVGLALLPVFLVVEAAITAGYLDCVDAACRGSDPDFARGVREHTLGMLVLRLALFVATFGVFIFALAMGPLSLVLAVPVVLAVGYLLYGAPYLLVARDVDAFQALGASVEYGLDGGRYASFAAGYLVVGAVASVPLSVLVRNAGFLGVAVGVALVAYPSLVGSVATMLVIRDISSDGGSRDGDGRPSNVPDNSRPDSTGDTGDSDAIGHRSESDEPNDADGGDGTDSRDDADHSG